MIHDAFNTYIVERNNKGELSSDQIRFLRMVKNVFAQKKNIEYNDFFEPPFINLGQDAALRFFTEKELKDMVHYFNSIQL